MENEQKKLLAYERAQKKVKRVKSFYNHLLAYIIINIPLLVFKVVIDLIDFNSDILGHPEYFNWIYLNAIFWGISLVVHALCVFSYNPFFGESWEKRQIQKFMQEEAAEANRYS